ncbi:MAG: arginase family protein [Candidatus Dojkabacteria bacterium]
MSGHKFIKRFRAPDSHIPVSQKIHLYKINSRYGLKYLPIHGHELNIGVEHGPDAVLSQQFLKELSELPHLHSYDFPLPEDVEDEMYFAEFAKHSRECADLITKTLEPGETQVVVGGDHSVGFSAILADLQRFPADRIGIIQFDSHADINSISSSPTGNIHGMFLRPFLAAFDNKTIARLIPRPIPTQNLLYIGNLEPDPEELKFIKEHSIPVFGRAALRNNFNDVQTTIANLLSRIDHLHISFDVDIFHRDLVSATGTPALDGLKLEEVFATFPLIQDFPSKSIDLVEVNPGKLASTQTVAIAQLVLTKLLCAISKKKQFQMQHTITVSDSKFCNL